MSHDPPALLCDRMLGALARWLRLAGIDTAYAAEGPHGPTDDAVLLAEASAQGRILLTRDVALAAAAGTGGLLLHSSGTLDQLREVVVALHLPLDGALQRCSRCNGLLGKGEGPPATRLLQVLPPQVQSGQWPYWVCPSCGQHYWEGSHTPKIRATLAAIALPQP